MKTTATLKRGKIHLKMYGSNHLFLLIEAINTLKHGKKMSISDVHVYTDIDDQISCSIQIYFLGRKYTGANIYFVTYINNNS